MLLALSTRLAAMWAEISSNLGLVSPFFANRTFAANRPWCIPDSWYTTVYTAAAVPLPLESQNAYRSNLLGLVPLCGNFSSRGQFPLNFSHCAFSSWGKQHPKGGVGHTRLWKPFSPPQLQDLLPQEGYILKLNFLGTSLFVASCESLEKVTGSVLHLIPREPV